MKIDLFSCFGSFYYTMSLFNNLLQENALFLVFTVYQNPFYLLVSKSVLSV